MRHFTTIFLCFILTQSVFGQKKVLFGGNNVAVKQMVSKIIVPRYFVDTFSFTKQWDYPEGVFKDDSTGEFTTDGSDLDTTHLFYTARCTTNVQGGYELRYCHAKIESGKIMLTFADGFPAYASEFYVYIDTSTFSCNVETIYPIADLGQKKYNTITSQKLIIDKGSYMPGDTIKGYINMTFVETVILSNKETFRTKLFFKGHFKTQLSN